MLRSTWTLLALFTVAVVVLVVDRDNDVWKDLLCGDLFKALRRDCVPGAHSHLVAHEVRFFLSSCVCVSAV